MKRNYNINLTIIKFQEHVEIITLVLIHIKQGKFNWQIGLFERKKVLYNYSCGLSTMNIFSPVCLLTKAQEKRNKLLLKKKDARC
jgi:hypothetical protein